MKSTDSRDGWVVALCAGRVPLDLPPARYVHQSWNEKFALFWDRVRAAEDSIEHNGDLHAQVMPAKEWDDDFEWQYDQIAPHILQLDRSGTLWNVPPKLPAHFAIGTCTAHQALMIFLNPPHALSATPWVIQSPEYLAVKQAALKELIEVLSAELRRSWTGAENADAIDFELADRLMFELYQSVAAFRGRMHEWVPPTERRLAKKLGVAPETIQQISQQQLPGGWLGFTRALAMGHRPAVPRPIQSDHNPAPLSPMTIAMRPSMMSG